MRLHAFFALLLIVHVCSAELTHYQDQVLKEFKWLNQKVDALSELHNQAPTPATNQSILLLIGFQALVQMAEVATALRCI